MQRYWKKSAKSEEKEGRHDVYLLIMLRYNVHGLRTFPNMVINVHIPTKWGKIRKKWRDRCRSLSMMLVHYLHCVCTFPNMVINRKIRRKSEKLRKTRIDMLLTRLRYCLHGLCIFPNMVIDANMPRTSEKNGVAKHRPSSTMLVYCLHHLCAFPNMVIHANIIIKRSGKIRKNEETDVDHCQQCWCIVYMVCADFLI